MQKVTAFARKSDGTLMTLGTGTWAVYQPGTTTPVTVYSTDSTGGGSPSFTIPVTGKIEFYARNADLKIVATQGADAATVDDFTVTAGITYGTLAARPAAGSADRVYVSSDAGAYYDDESAWQPLPVEAAALRNSAAAAGYSMLNGTLVPSVAGNALTVTIKTLAGANPSASDPVFVLVRSATAATGDYTVLKLTAATSLVVSSGSTLGTANSVPFRFWVVGFNDGGTFRLGVINCLVTAAGAGAGRDVSSIYPLGQFPIASSTAEGGAGAADTAQTFYTGSAVTSKPYAVLGYLTYEAGLAAAGTYASAPTRAELYHRGVPLPGAVVQVQRTATGAVATGTTAIPDDDTIPAITEGDQYMSQAITPSSAANVIRARAKAHLVNSNGIAAIAAMFNTDLHATQAIAVSSQYAGGAAIANQVIVEAQVLAVVTSASTYRIRGGANSGSTTTFNGVTSSRKFGGVFNSFLQVDEVQG